MTAGPEKSQLGHFEADEPPGPKTGSCVQEARVGSPGKVARELRGKVISATLRKIRARNLARELASVTAVLEGRVGKPRMKKRTKTLADPQPVTAGLEKPQAVTAVLEGRVEKPRKKKRTKTPVKPYALTSRPWI